MPVIDTTPQLTVYRNGLVNLNGEATRAFTIKGADSLLLLAPTRTEPQWLLLPAAEGVSGEIRLHGRADRGNLRFRAPGLALALFAALPPEQDALRLLCEPVARTGWRLVACCAKSAQQNITADSLAA
ncbi:MAG: hypothetical protein EOO57_16080 [Hymenobacter sp.]|nr:MAG: hypothetical protein EOO57_16080 [Hymenobacter sp.]